MLLGKVVGTLVATRKEPSMEGFKFLVLRQIDVDGEEIGGLCGRRGRSGSRCRGGGSLCHRQCARQTVATNNRPCDAVVMAIVDSWEVGGEELFHKHR